MLGIGDIVVEGGISYEKVLSISCHSKKNSYTNAKVVLQLNNTSDKSQITLIKNKNITIRTSNGILIIQGICINTSFENTGNEYGELNLTVVSSSYQLTQKHNKRTFQSQNKTLEDIFSDVINPYHGVVSVSKNINIKPMITQKNESDWDFICRTSCENGMDVYDDGKHVTPFLYIGDENLPRAKKGDLSIQSQSRDLLQCSKSNIAGFSTVPYDYETITAVSDNLAISAGNIVGDFLVMESVIVTEEAMVKNQITLKSKSDQEVTAAGAKHQKIKDEYCNFYKGSVLEIDGTNVKVHLEVDKEQNKSEAMWMPYENTINNFIYCMPDVGDTVFVYYESTGLAICIGSQHKDSNHPDFSDIKSKMMTSADKMIKFSEDYLELLAGKEEKESGGNNYSTIFMNLSDGIQVTGKESILVRSLEGSNVEIKTDKNDGSIGISALSSIDLYVGSSTISIDDGNINISAQNFFWEGYNKGSGYEKKEDRYVKKSWWDVLLAGAQLVLDVASIFAPPLIDSALSLASAGISFAQGDVAGGMLGLVGAIPLAGKVAKCGKLAKVASKAGKAGKVATKAGKAVKTVVTTVKGLKYAKQAWLVAKLTVRVVTAVNEGKTLCKNIPVIYELCKEGKFDPFGNPDDALILLETLDAGVSLGTAIRDGVKDVDSYNKNKNAGNSHTPEGDDVPEKTTDGPDGEGSKVSGDETPNKDTAGDPVDMVTGSLYLTYTEAVIATIAGEFRLTRTYESVYTNEQSMLGDKWVFNIGSSICCCKDNLTLKTLDGHLEHFTKVDGIWFNQRKSDLSYQVTEEREYFIVKHIPDKKIYIYSAQGNLLEIIDHNGNQTVLEYDSSHQENQSLKRIHFSGGQYLDFSYCEGKVSCITDTAGRTIHYEYTKEYLSSVRYQNGGTICYEYCGKGFISAIWDQKGIKYIQNKYDASGRVIHQQMSDGEEYAYFYDGRNKKNTIINVRKNAATHYIYENGLVKSILYPDMTSLEKQYDENHHLIAIKNRRDGITRYEHNVFGQIVKEIHPKGLTYEFTYDEGQHMVEKRDSAGRNLKVSYDGKGNIIKTCKKIQNQEWQITYYEYDSFGRLTMVQDSNGHQMIYEYDSRFSKPISTRRPEGEEYIYSYDKIGRCISKTTEDGTVRYEYNELGYCTCRINEEGAETKFFYNPMGSITEIIQPEQGKQAHSHGTRYFYDDMDHLSMVLSAGHRKKVYERDSEGRVRKKYNEVNSEGPFDPDIDYDTFTEYQYDFDGNNIQVIYPDGGILKMEYDAAKNLVKRILPEENENIKRDVTKLENVVGFTYEYDEDNHLTKVINPKGIVEKSFLYDLAGRIIKEFTAKGYVNSVGTIYQYNTIGWVTEVRKPLRIKEGNVFYQLTQYQYDTVGNVISELWYLEEQTESSSTGKLLRIARKYDKNNRVIEVTDSMGARIRYRYNHRNQCIFEQRRINQTCEMEYIYHYDAVGRLKDSMQYYASNKTEKLYHKTSYRYDMNGNCVEIILSNQNRIYRHYDADNLLLSQEWVEPHGSIHTKIEYKYNAAKQVVKVTTDTLETEYEYDSCQRTIKKIVNHTATTSYQYDKNGSLICKISPKEYALNQNKAKGIRYEYDRLQHLKRILRPDGSVLVSYEYNEDGELVLQRDGREDGLAFEYDLAGRRIRISRLPNDLREVSNEQKGLQEINAEQKALQEVIAKQNVIPEIGAEQKTLQEISTLQKTLQQYEYDARGNVIAVIDGNGNRTSYLVTPWGNIHTIQKPDGNTLQYDYDFAGNVIQQIDENGNHTFFGYNECNQLAWREDDVGKRELFAYNEMGRLCRHQKFDGTNIYFNYNMFGSLTYRGIEYKKAIGLEQENQEGKQQEYHDEKQQVKQKEKQEDRQHGKRQEKRQEKEEEIYAYFSNGQLSYAIGGGMRYDYQYDDFGRVLGKRASGKLLLAYEYDLNGNKIRQTDVSGKDLRYKYDDCDRLITIFDGDKAPIRYHYRTDDRISRVQIGNLITNNMEYDADKNLISQITTLNADQNPNSLIRAWNEDQNPVVRRNTLNTAQNPQVLLHLTLNYDNNGNIIGRKEGDKNTSYVYDSLNQLIGIKTPETVEKFSYDAVGNRIAYETKNNRYHYEYNSLNQLIHMEHRQDGQFIGQQDLSYDLNGNLVVDARISYTYDAFDRMIKAEKYTPQLTGNGSLEERGNGDSEGLPVGSLDGKTAGNSIGIPNDMEQIQINRYDAEGLRYEMQENDTLIQFIYSDNKIVTESTEGEVIRYIRGGHQLIASDSERARTYYHYVSDDLGSIRLILDENQQVINQYQYDAFGNIIDKKEQIANRFGYAGEVYDHLTGQYYLRARFYNPVIGRFTQADTYYGDGSNLYTYCANNPLRYIDPSGHSKLDANDQKPGDRQALQELIDEVNARGGASIEEREILMQWANEYGVDIKPDDIKSQLLLECGGQGGGSKGGLKADFYVKPNGDVIPSTGYRYSARNTTVIQNAKSGTIAARADGTYFSFDSFDDAVVAQGKLQIPYRPEYRIGFDTLDIIDDISIPNGKWGTASYLEPITNDFKNFGPGKATQAVTYSEINSVNEISKLR